MLPCRSLRRRRLLGTHWTGCEYWFGKRLWIDLRERNLESLLNRLQYLLISLAADEGDRKTLGSETTGTTNTMEVGVGVAGQIVVDGQVDTLNVDTTAEDIGSNADTLLEVLERLVALDTA